MLHFFKTCLAVRLQWRRPRWLISMPCFQAIPGNRRTLNKRTPRPSSGASLHGSAFRVNNGLSPGKVSLIPCVPCSSRYTVTRIPGGFGSNTRRSTWLPKASAQSPTGFHAFGIPPRACSLFSMWMTLSWPALLSTWTTPGTMSLRGSVLTRPCLWANTLGVTT